MHEKVAVHRKIGNKSKCVNKREGKNTEKIRKPKDGNREEQKRE